ncbi:MAG: hypothetical protein A3A31_01140 [Candidatus Zambryskibacteria bacterium RIFCSPLOWO2_01_FULL_48_25]|uniref:Uncharacterized protein n=1 Tax=Candidatus Zambryskibacteria bacterium RIFCSPHIGHO2_01_FULL_46_25 TaxID=1802738 RepID=A0A1G2T152_9BACT|nr:MAG: hypothetical protein A2838_01995 [Candidatus Zambryskibacteria bacterium RIFCSPHIGHO2_01_FULL_46_25]OHB06892.1 MAG: hypothetical protein A3A31_01140 [Candidatus Zambryskibacteria bacterium RIFCSPLOWO2_01_FULL_48_25]
MYSKKRTQIAALPLEVKMSPRNGVVVALFMLAALTLLYTVAAWDLEKARRENAALKVEIAEWQKAMLPAYYARYPEAMRSPLPMDTAAFKPDLLRATLNPCVTMPEGLYVDTDDCHNVIANTSPYGSRGIPIKVVLDLDR